MIERGRRGGSVEGRGSASGAASEGSERWRGGGGYRTGGSESVMVGETRARRRAQSFNGVRACPFVWVAAKGHVWRCHHYTPSPCPAGQPATSTASRVLYTA